MEIYHFKGLGRCESKCGLNIHMRDDRAVVMLTELDDNRGTSVTNYIEYIATLIYRERLNGCPVESIRWIEHYPANGDKEETFDEVFFKWDGQRFVSPQWRRIEPCQL